MLVNAACAPSCGARGIWQRRFWEHAIRDDEDMENHVGYIHWNPVKHGHVAAMDDWPYSSWRRFKADHGKEWEPPIDGNFGEP